MLAHARDPRASSQANGPPISRLHWGPARSSNPSTTRPATTTPAGGARSPSSACVCRSWPGCPARSSLELLRTGYPCRAVQWQVYFGYCKTDGGLTGAGVTELGAPGSSRLGLLGMLILSVGAAGCGGAIAAADVVVAVAVVVVVFVVVLVGLLLGLLPHAVSPPIAMIATAPV